MFRLSSAPYWIVIIAILTLCVRTHAVNFSRMKDMIRRDHQAYFVGPNLRRRIGGASPDRLDEASRVVFRNATTEIRQIGAPGAES